MNARRVGTRRTTIVEEPKIVGEFLRDGMVIAVGGFINSSHPMALVREVIRSGVADLTVVGAAMSGLEVDMLVAARCVRKVVSSYVAAEGYAPIAPMFRWACEEGEIEVWDCDETMYYSALRAGAMELPFMPVSSGLGTSLPELNPDLRLFDDPVTGRPLIAVPALRPEIALIHAARSDAYGNVQFEATGFGDRALYRASVRTIAQVERIVPTEVIRAEPWRTAMNRIEAVVRAPFGCHPFGSPSHYREDARFLTEYVEVVRDARRRSDRSAVDDWVDDHLRSPVTHLDYLDALGVRRIVSLMESEEGE